MGGEVTECQPGWEGIGVQPRWEGHGDVVPKIVNLRNHYGTDTDANPQVLISKLEFASKYTRHREAGTWTSWWVFA